MGVARDYFIEVVDDIAGMWQSAQGDRDATREEIAGYIDSTAAGFQRWALEAALEKVGLTIDLSNGLSDESITAAINDGPLSGSGVVLESVLNRGALLSGLEGLAMSKACESFGLQGVGTASGLREGVRQWIAAEIASQIEDGAGALVDGAPNVASLQKIIDSGAVVKGWNEPSDMTAAGVSNRERQERYRSAHKRTWVAR